MSHVKIKNIEIFTYTLPYLSFKERKGLILKITDENGKEGFGEISPLEGRSRETFDLALNLTKQFREKIFLSELSPMDFPPSVLFGIESAITSLSIPDGTKIPFDYYDLHIPSLSDPSTLSHCPKLKLGNLSLQSAIEESKFILDSKEQIRIDLNRMWPMAKTLQFLEHFDLNQILYIEEPVDKFTDLEKFYKISQCPYALDEHLDYQPIEKIASLAGLKLISVKPTLHGGSQSILALKRSAPNLQITLSSTFESGIGQANIILLAHKLGIKPSLGIGTYRYFQEDLLDIQPYLKTKELPISAFKQISLSEKCKV